MRRTVMLSGVAAFVMSVLGTVVASVLVVPTLAPKVVGAQDARLRAEHLTVVGDNGVDRVLLQTGPGGASSVRLLDPSGDLRVMTSTGGQDRGDDPDAAGIAFRNSSGTQVIRLGTGRGPLSNGPLVQGLQLTDQQGRQRAWIRVEEDGSPNILLLDADGTVVWSAP